MTLALVGSVGAVNDGASGFAVTPNWGTSETRAAGNLLVAWYATNNGTGTTASPPSGWAAAIQGNVPQSGILTALGSWGLLYKQAAGGDAAPTITGAAGSAMSIQVAEFSGYPGAVYGGFDESGGAVGGAAAVTATASVRDLGSGDLEIIVGFALYSTAATKTLTLTANNGVTVTSSATNNAVSTIGHYAFGYGLTTSVSASTNATLTPTTTKLTSDGVGFITFTPSGPSVVVGRHRAPRPAHYRPPQRGRY